jgi:dipeptidase D
VTNPLSQLQPSLLWTHFDRIRQIPRASGEEAAIVAYVETVARERAWSLKRDTVGNVCLKVPATAGRQSARPVVLQGHLDMVCEKEPDLDFDFSKNPIELRVEGDWVASVGTTLGADNGIGVAAALAVCEDPLCQHGPVEVLLTVDEEAGGTGAGQLDPGLVQGRILVNLDSEDDATMVVGCAGGCSTEIEYAARRAPAPKDHVPVRIAVGGLRGGHSGLTIHENRGNAVKLLARVLHRLLAKADLYLGACEGGNKHNAIPRTASAIVHLPKDFLPRARDIVHTARNEVVSEVGSIEPDLRITLEPVEPQSAAPFDCSSTRRLVRLLVALPHGVLAMSREAQGVVETSTNLATVITDLDRVNIVNASRSLRDSNLRFLLDQIDAISRLSGADAAESEGYPPWRTDPASPLASTLREVYTHVIGRAPAVTIMHAGLECGVIAQRIPDMQMISFGPLIQGAHAPGERVSIASVQRFYNVLTALLAKLG